MLVQPFLSGGTARLFPGRGSYEFTCSKYSNRGFCGAIGFNFSRACLPRRKIVGSYGKCMFNFIGDCQAVSKVAVQSVISYEQCVRVPVLCLFATSWYRQGGLLWYLVAVSTYISLMANDVGHLFVCWFVILLWGVVKSFFFLFLPFSVLVVSFLTEFKTIYIVCICI